MHYGKKSPSMGTPSVYSHVTSRSSANLRSSRSVKSLKVPWYRKPILQESIFLDVQRSSLITAFFSLVRSIFFIKMIWNIISILKFQFVSLFTIIVAVFDVYCYSMAAPGSTHYGYYILSYQFVYVGNSNGKYIC